MCALNTWVFVTLLLFFEVKCNFEQDVQPKLYKLKLIPFLDNSFNFTGEVFIGILCTVSTTEIRLHASNLTIHHVQLSRNGKEFPSSYEMWKKQNILYIKTQGYMAFNGKYVIHIKYQGYLNNEQIGFFRSFYRIDRQTKWLAATHFEPSFAQMAFPCFDEPRHRTPFDISVARYKNQIALSNMPVKETSEEDPNINNRVWDTFQTTPPMSTYLVAVVVCDFVSNPSPDDRRITIWTRENAITDADYSLNISALILGLLEMYTGINFNLPKLDLIALPEFESAAMKNWGLTTYRESSLLHQNDNSSAKEMETINLIIAHKFIHQWFGGYVTPEWWDYFWLNEAFATYLKYKILTMIEPTWRLDKYFVTEVLQNVLFLDEVKYHHAMTRQIRTTAESEIFDLITYQKGGSVLRMFEYIMTPPSFQKALTYYLNEGNTNGGIVKPENLWKALDKQALQDKIKLPLLPSEIMTDWTTNRGYPLVNVTRIAQNDSIIIEQTTYKSPRSLADVVDQKWIIPLTYTTSHSMNFSNTKPTHWSGINSSSNLQLSVPLQHKEWILFNIQQTGYYRVTYDLDNWKLLVNQLYTRLDDIHVLNRAQLIDDSFALAFDEKLSYEIPINLANYLANEFDMIPWFAAIKNFNYLFTQYQSTAISDTVSKYLTDIIDVQYSRVGAYERFDDDHLTKTGRTSVITLACLIGHSHCITKMEKLYEIFSYNLSKVPAHLKYPVYCTMLQYGNTYLVWEKLWSIYKRTNFASESETILSTVGCMNDEKLIANILTKIISNDDTDIRKQSKIIALRSIYQTSNGITATLNFIANLVLKQENLQSSTMAKIISLAKQIKSHVKSEEQIKLLKKLINDVDQEDKNFTTLTNALKNAYQEGLKKVLMTETRMEELKCAIENRMPPIPFIESIKNADSSFTTKLISSFWLNLMNLGIILLYVYSRRLAI